MAVHAVDVVPVDEGGADDRVQGVEVEAVIGVALADPLPEHLGRGTVLVEQQHAGPAVLRREEQVAAAVDGGRGVDAHVDDVAYLPVHLAGLGVERADVARVPRDELPRAARLDDDGLAVAGLPVRRQGPPDLLAGVLVERHHLGVGLAPHEADEAVAVDERRAGHAPRRHLGAEVGGKVPLPPQPSRRRHRGRAAGPSPRARRRGHRRRWAWPAGRWRRRAAAPRSRSPTPASTAPRRSPRRGRRRARRPPSTAGRDGGRR